MQLRNGKQYLNSADSYYVSKLRERLLRERLSEANDLLSDEECVVFLVSKKYDMRKTIEMVKQWLIMHVYTKLIIKMSMWWMPKC
jgi:hypothetical protein